MFHPLWEDVAGQVSAADVKKPHCNLCGSLCEECGHPTKVHRANGACYGASHCMCGWSKDMTGSLWIKKTGEYAGDASVKIRRRNKGAKISVNKRKDLMEIPCYFCGGIPNTVDHLVARAKGGTNQWANLVSACDICNCMKSDKSYDDLIYFCQALEMVENRKTGLKKFERLNQFKEQARKILAWHEIRMASRPK